MDLLAELVNNPNYTPGMRIILVSCNLGGKTSGYITSEIKTRKHQAACLVM